MPSGENQDRFINLEVFYIDIREKKSAPIREIFTSILLINIINLIKSRMIQVSRSNCLNFVGVHYD